MILFLPINLPKLSIFSIILIGEMNATIFFPALSALRNVTKIFKQIGTDWDQCYSSYNIILKNINKPI